MIGDRFYTNKLREPSAPYHQARPGVKRLRKPPNLRGAHKNHGATLPRMYEFLRIVMRSELDLRAIDIDLKDNSKVKASCQVCRVRNHTEKPRLHAKIETKFFG